MLTIPIKIAKEDKAIMVELLESAKTYSVDFSNLDMLIGYEIYIEILSKLRASQHNDKSIRLSLIQVKVFFEFLTVYSKVGKYEMANAHLLYEHIRKEIYKKAVKINH